MHSLSTIAAVTRIASVAVALITAISAAGAHEVAVDGATLNIPTPNGYCIVSENAEDPNSISNIYKTSHPGQLLLVVADCSELQLLKAKSGGTNNVFEDFITFASQWGNFDEPRERFLQQLAKKNSRGQSIAQASNQGLSRLLQFGAEDEYRNDFGLIGIDANAVYFGVGFVQTERNGKTKVRTVAVSAHSLIIGVRLVVTKYRPYTSKTDLQGMYDGQRELLAKFVMANQN